jgi:hypothetical protein
MDIIMSDIACHGTSHMRAAVLSTSGHFTRASLRRQAGTLRRLAALESVKGKGVRRRYRLRLEHTLLATYTSIPIYHYYHHHHHHLLLTVVSSSCSCRGPEFHPIHSLSSLVAQPCTQPITTPRLYTWRSQRRPVRIVSIVLHLCLHPAWNINLPARRSAQSCSPARSCTPGWGCLGTSEAVPVLASSRTVQQSCPRNARRVRPLHPPS